MIIKVEDLPINYFRAVSSQDRDSKAASSQDRDKMARTPLLLHLRYDNKKRRFVHEYTLGRPAARTRRSTTNGK